MPVNYGKEHTCWFQRLLMLLLLLLMTVVPVRTDECPDWPPVCKYPLKYHCWPDRVDKAGCYKPMLCHAGQISVYDEKSLTNVTCRDCNGAFEFQQEILESNDRDIRRCLPKYKCDGEGQMVAVVGSNKENSKCGCNYTAGYVQISKKLRWWPCLDSDDMIYTCSCTERSCDSGSFWHLVKWVGKLVCRQCDLGNWTDGTQPCQKKREDCPKGYRLQTNTSTSIDNECLVEDITNTNINPDVAPHRPGEPSSDQTEIVVGSVGGSLVVIAVVVVLGIVKCRRRSRQSPSSSERGLDSSDQSSEDASMITVNEDKSPEEEIIVEPPDKTVCCGDERSEPQDCARETTQPVGKPDPQPGPGLEQSLPSVPPASSTYPCTGADGGPGKESSNRPHNFANPFVCYPPPGQFSYQSLGALSPAAVSPMSTTHTYIHIHGGHVQVGDRNVMTPNTEPSTDKTDNNSPYLVFADRPSDSTQYKHQYSS